MTGQIRKPKQALNKAYLKLKPTRDEIERFKKNLIVLIDKIDIKEGEEHAKNLVRDFLRETYYKDLYEINVKNRNDLVIHSEKTSDSPVSVIIEAKRPSEKYDFPAVNNLNVKAMQELVLYYLRERVDCSNSDIRHLIATNGNEWFIFDSQDFHRCFYSNSALLKEYDNWNSGKKDSASTQMFYNDIAKKYIEEIKNDIPFTYFNIKDYDKFLRNENKEDDKNLIPLYKLLSPSHLLKLSFSNDSNSLDKNFYYELLHIIGLEEVKDGSKKIIRRKKAPDEGSLLENAINILKSEDKLYKVNNPDTFGKTKDDQYFGIALELCITWINRILFLKLLEAQLLKYFKDREYKFLTYENIGNFDALNKLFFQVLAVSHDSRSDSVKKKFPNIPYLNSSLFEASGLEDDLIRISNLEDDVLIPIISKTVLKETDGRKKSGNVKTLKYLFDFLDSYDFSSEGSEDIQEERKTLINSSVLGLIFEKINGYKDGSFFTPGFITMYMCRETIRRSVIQKFNDAFEADIKDFGELKNFVGVPYKKEDIKKFNDTINSLKICDPAVGSGHFLVSALNEIIAIKSELNILADSEGNRLIGYSAFVENDELMLVNTISGDLFDYKPGNPESQKLQEVLFHEKQTIIENCLFGVDINHNSVKICRLRLWIELLKNAYYTKASNYKELETLPNIDINIKCGNSLVSRFGLDADLSSALRKSKWTITSYRLAVQSYQNAKTKDEKRELEKLLNEIKNNFRTEISDNDPKQKKLERLESELFEKYTSNKLLFVILTDKEKAKEEKEKQKLVADIEKAKAEIKEIKESAIYRNAFEWRFEFPEVLDEKGNYIGFDVVIENPPYGVNFNKKEAKPYENTFETFNLRGESYVLFVEKSHKLLRVNGRMSLIIPDTILNLGFTNKIREYILNKSAIEELVLLPAKVFVDASVDTILIFLINRNIANYPNERVRIKTFSKKQIEFDLNDPNRMFYINVEMWKQQKSFNLQGESNEISLIQKIDSLFSPLREFSEMYSGIKVYEVGKGIPPQSEAVRVSKPFTSIRRESEEWLPFFDGKHINTYSLLWKDDNWIRYGKWLAAPREAKNFEGEKILIRKITGQKLISTYISYTSYCNTLLFVLKLLPEKSNHTYKSLLGVLNSKFIGWYFRKKFQISNEDTFPQIMIRDILQFAIPNQKTVVTECIEKLVNQILIHKKQDLNTDTSTLGAEIDKLVYQLYGLTEEDIKIVERG